MARADKMPDGLPGSPVKLYTEPPPFPTDLSLWGLFLWERKEAANEVPGYRPTNKSGSPLPLLPEQTPLVVVYGIPHDIVGCPGELVAYRLDSHDPICPCHLPFIVASYHFMKPSGKVGSFNVGLRRDTCCHSSCSRILLSSRLRSGCS